MKTRKPIVNTSQGLQNFLAAILDPLVMANIVNDQKRFHQKFVNFNGTRLFQYNLFPHFGQREKRVCFEL